MRALDKIRVLIADDNVAVREELPKLLEMDGDIEVIGAAENGRAAVDIAAARLPDVVVMDVKMPELDGITATKAIRAANPEVRVIMLSNYDKDEYLATSLEAGAVNYVVKDVEIDTLANAIRRAFQEESERSSKQPDKHPKKSNGRQE